jgi:hypothetical protein
MNRGRSCSRQSRWRKRAKGFLNSKCKKGFVMASHKLIFEKLEKKHEALVQHFDCGGAKHEEWLARWIKTDAFYLRTRGTSIWLAFTDDRQLVGFGSLNTHDQPTEEDDGSKGKIRWLTMPAFALQLPFWGQPKNVDRSERYSRQIVRHVQQQAREKFGRAEAPLEPALALLVHEQATKAQELYKECGFVVVSKHHVNKGEPCFIMMYMLN